MSGRVGGAMWILVPALALALAACGEDKSSPEGNAVEEAKESSAPAATEASENKQASEGIAEDAASDGPALVDDITPRAEGILPDLYAEAVVEPSAASADATTDAAPANAGESQKDALADYIKKMQQPGMSQADREKALKEYMAAAQSEAKRSRVVRQPQDLKLPEDWKKTYRVEKNGKEAELLVQVGDIDNLGFGWPAGFDPFSGESTPIHAFPWAPEKDDPPGTDRIMVNSSAKDSSGLNRKDGYTRETTRPDNTPRAIQIEFDASGVSIKSAVLQLFVDDFQAPVMKSRFIVALDGRPAPDIEATINQLNQTGPIGKLVTIRLLPEYLGLLADGKLRVYVDDKTSEKVGDGFAFDFARLLINPKGFTYTGTIRGTVVDKADGKPIEGVLVSASNVRQATTQADGKFELRDVPAGLVITTGNHPDYIPDSKQTDLVADATESITLKLEKTQQEDLAKRLENDGKVDLYGIFFDTDKAVLKPESEETLQQVLKLLRDKPALKLAVAGHTDAQAGDAYNLDLSKRRAQAVVAWLTAKGIAATRLQANGYGETQPVADNASSAGRALNRRVEIRDTTQ